MQPDIVPKSNVFRFDLVVTVLEQPALALAFIPATTESTYERRNRHATHPLAVLKRPF
jgi:hypothetical protein